MVSEIVWLVILLAALAWELVGVFRERQWRIEPLTRIVRDRLFVSRAGIVFRLVFISFWVWLGLHWLLPLKW